MDHRQSKNIASSASLATCSKPKQVHDQPYTYQPISSDHAIRVATIQLGEYGSPLTITLREVELPRKGNGWAVPEYQTLSYEWGQDGRDRPIYCDGRILLITRNLEAALQRLRSTDEPLLIWMDSICIDQDNVAERSHQVSMMALIYKSSPRVNMWLGEENETTQEGISMLESLDKLYDQLKKRLKSRRSSESWLEDDIMSINYLRSILGDEAGIENEKPERWDAFRDIMSRSYFERTWIAQEVLLSWKRHDRESLSYWRLVALAIFVERIWKGVAFTIIELLQQLHMSRCRDPRDMVYAVLGMIQYPHGAISKSQAVATGLPIPDYTKSIEQVYQDTAAAIITSNQDLALFFNIQVPRMRNISTMPTWAIDWSPSPEGWWHASNPKIEQVGAIKPLNAFQKNSFVRPVPHGTAPIFPATDTMPISVAGRVLTAPGLSLGDVVWTSNPLHVDGFVFSLVELQSSVNQRCGNSLIDKYITGEPMIQALCKTILMGTNDTEAKGRGYETSGPGGWTPMFESFFGVLVSNDMMKRRNEMEGIPEDLFRLMCIQQTGAGLFLSAAKSVGNQRVFQTGKAGLMGIAALDVKEGDRVVLLRGAYAPVVVRRVKAETRKGRSSSWEIFCEAYVHGAMDDEDEVFQDGLCGDWDTYEIM